MKSAIYYTTAEVASITGFSSRRLNYWAAQRIVVPSIQESHGPGTRRLYSLDDLVALYLIKYLLGYGWSTQRIRQVTPALLDLGSSTASHQSTTLYTCGTAVLMIFKTRTIERQFMDHVALEHGQAVVRVVLETLQEEVERGLSRLRLDHPIYKEAMEDD